jgi:hypothetical protein
MRAQEIPRMSVPRAVAKVGTEIMNILVEIPARQIPIRELMRVSLRTLLFT